MTTEQYSIGYEAGYQDGWDAALAEQPAEQSANPVGAVFQEPVAWRLLDEDPYGGDDRWVYYDSSDFRPGTNPEEHFNLEPLYTAPQAAKRVPLTDDDIDVLWAKQQTKPFKTHAEDRMAFARAVIAAYEAKNGITGEAK